MGCGEGTCIVLVVRELIVVRLSEVEVRRNFYSGVEFLVSRCMQTLLSRHAICIHSTRHQHGDDAIVSDPWVRSKSRES